MESERTQLEGSVAAVVFQNPENGYSVLRLNAGGKEPVTVVGVVPSTSVAICPPTRSGASGRRWRRRSWSGSARRA